MFSFIGLNMIKKYKLFDGLHIFQELSQAPLSATQAIDWLIFRMAKKFEKFQDTKGIITNKLVKDLNNTLLDDKMTLEDKQKKYADHGLGMSLLHVYFKDLGVIKYTREESYGAIDLIGNIMITS